MRLILGSLKKKEKLLPLLCKVIISDSLCGVDRIVVLCQKLKFGNPEVKLKFQFHSLVDQEPPTSTCFLC